ncbi:hypothetical protein [Cylindrospermum sp. FACHB-282]|uniref:hypothetical protein n=1 Tax=Cylindrospermum sp. FACHB-282 TaxID=2692794 RepID=UPI001687CF9C|nr:hypothetical protein [Cylindrospermum sp. FACHB-282]MBD2385258.1 hypothetical protein [Cylindrospermum sp. FACHB-282]
MGSTTKYDPKDLCTVLINPGDEQGVGALNYAFYTNIPKASRNILGISTIADTTQLPVGTALTPSYPKPAKASKRFQTKSSSSYVAAANFNGARVDGWTVTRNRKLPSVHLTAEGSSFVRTVYVTIRGIKYAWHMPKVTIGRIGDADLAALGIKYATENDVKDLVFGAEFPKPGKARKLVVSGTGNSATASNVITFYDPEKEFPANWSPVSNAYVIL